MINQEEHTLLIDKLVLKHQCWGLGYVTTVTHIYLLKEIYQSIVLQQQQYNRNKKVIFKNCAPFTDCISKINNTQIDNAKDFDIVMPMYNLIKYSDNYSKTSGNIWQYCKDTLAVNNNGNLVDFNGANATDSFNFKTKITGQTNGIINIDIMVPLKYLSNFWRTLQMPLINWEVEFILTRSANCVIIYTDVANQNPKFTITDKSLCSSSYFIKSR